MDRDMELVSRIADGSEEAFTTLVELHEKKIYNHCFRMCQNKEDAMDLTQDIFIRIYKSIGSFKGQCALSTWIYRIAANMCIDHLRKKKKGNVISLNIENDQGEEGVWELPDLSQAPEEIYTRTEMAEALEEGLKDLSDEHRQMILMRDLNHLSYDEIAEALELEAGTVKSRIHRARSQLRKILLTKNGNLFSAFTSKKMKGGS